MSTLAITAASSCTAVAILGLLAWASVRRLARRGYKIQLALVSVTLTPASVPRETRQKAAAQTSGSNQS